MLRKILDFALQYKMFPDECEVVCGLSGGADSVCLMISLIELRKELGISKVSAIHINHCLRGEESDRDEAYCRELCKKLDVDFTSVSCNVIANAEKFGLSIEESARKMRYEVFEKYSDGKIIATAHNANDNLETVIHNLSRGSALKGICGIPPIRDNIVRPLLTVSRSEIEAYLAEKKIDFVTDSTNLSDDYTRNKIRHNVIPLLEQLNQSLVKTSVNSISALRLENSFIESETAKAVSKCRRGSKFIGLSDFHKVIRQRCMAEYFSENSISYSFERLEMTDNIIVNGGKLNVSGNFFLVSDGVFAEFVNIEKNVKSEEISVPLKIGDNSIFDKILLNASILNLNDSESYPNINKKFANSIMDYDKIKGTMILRNRKNGDKIRLSGRNFTSSVKKLINAQINQSERPYLHFIEDEEGTIFAEKIGIADRVKSDENTRNFLKITIKTQQ